MGPPFRLSDQPGQLTSINCPVKLSAGIKWLQFWFPWNSRLFMWFIGAKLLYYFLLSTSAIKTKTKFKIWETTINMVANYKLLIKEL